MHLIKTGERRVIKILRSQCTHGIYEMKILDIISKTSDSLVKKHLFDIHRRFCRQNWSTLGPFQELA